MQTQLYYSKVQLVQYNAEKVKVNKKQHYYMCEQSFHIK